jgi:hypothetical protein
VRLKLWTALSACAVLAALTASMGPALAVGHGPRGPRTAGRAVRLAWTVVPSPNRPNSEHQNVLGGVSCPSARACMAVGQSDPLTLAEHWNGTTWTILAAPRLPIGSGILDGVSCVSVRACTAVGFRGYGFQTFNLVETWNGGKWTVVPSPNVPSKDNGLEGVSCVSARACTAVGSFGTVNPLRSSTLIESWNGTAWTIVPSPRLVHPGTYDILDSVSCVTARYCTAVGERGAGDEPLIETWNGTVWKVVPAAKASSAFGALLGVVCLSPAACTAVGEIDSAHGGTFVESWNGTAWKVVPSPNGGPASALSELDGVSCISVRDCTAVGSFDDKGVTRTLIEAWNGTVWKVVSSPNKEGHGTGDFLDSVSCASAVMCSAVGDYGGLSRRKTLIELGIPPAPLRGGDFGS